MVHRIFRKANIIVPPGLGALGDCKRTLMHCPWTIEMQCVGGSTAKLLLGMESKLDSHHCEDGVKVFELKYVIQRLIYRGDFVSYLLLIGEILGLHR